MHRTSTATAGAPIEDFGGTSQSSPLTAGTAALVIGAYEKAHHGARPSPALVKSIIVGTAQDLGHPAFEQGAGEVDALAAVRAALSMPAPGQPLRAEHGDRLAAGDQHEHRRVSISSI